MEFFVKAPFVHFDYLPLPAIAEKKGELNKL
jgi:hypothetical protein